ncbi:hydroxyacid dehydrogenase [Pelagibius marinus]|uniref:hydroxyacid dehydrogenase n=1 Tax=Pelagibius marinus TaxID=2762760 RepID=UPI0018727035|nr:hydroxyacid dehydrogenase [Pelagibius marinus]
MPDIVISEFMDEAAVEELRGSFDLLYDPGLVDRPDDLKAALAGARALIVRNRTRVTDDVLAAGPGLVCVGRLGVGLDNIDLKACEARGVKVFPATGANDQAVAEYVVAAALLLLRGAYHAGGEMLAGAWPRQALMGREVAGKILGLVGFGGIARQVAARARPLGVTLAAVDPFVAPDDPAWNGVVRHETLESLLPEADVVSLHVPLTEGTRGLIGAAALKRMRPGAVLINTARGGVVDEVALAESLKAGHLGGAALDVFADEPLSAEAAAVFAGLPNLILTPHIAGVTVEANVRVSAMTARQVRAALEETA